MTDQIGKLLIFFGSVIVLTGLLIIMIGKSPLGRLPGDIVIKKDNFTFFFPLTTCILISVLLTVILWVLSRLR